MIYGSIIGADIRSREVRRDGRSGVLDAPADMSHHLQKAFPFLGGASRGIPILRAAKPASRITGRSVSAARALDRSLDTELDALELLLRLGRDGGPSPRHGRRRPPPAAAKAAITPGASGKGVRGMVLAALMAVAIAVGIAVPLGLAIPSTPDAAADTR